MQNMKVRGQLVLKLEWKQADWRTRPIALHFQLTQSIDMKFLCCVWCNKLLLLLLLPPPLHPFNGLFHDNLGKPVPER